MEAGPGAIQKLLAFFLTVAVSMKKNSYFTFSNCDLVFSHLKEVMAAIKIQSEQLRDTSSDLLYPHSRFKATFTGCWQFGV